MSENDIKLFGIKLKYYKYLFSRHWCAILVCGFVGLIISNMCRPLNDDVWSSFFSFIALIFVAFVTVIIVFYIARIELISRSMIKGGNSQKMIQDTETVKNETVSMLTNIIPIIILSVILMPLGYLEVENNFILDIWNNFKLDWFFIFGAIGFSCSTFYKILDHLQILLHSSYKQ